MPAAVPIIVFIASVNFTINFTLIYSNAVYNETFGRVKFARNVFRRYVCRLVTQADHPMKPSGSVRGRREQPIIDWNNTSRSMDIALQNIY